MTELQMMKTDQPRVPALFKAGFWIGCVIAVAVVIRRLVALTLPAAATTAASPLGNLDAAFAGHARLTLAHIIPALLFVVATPLVLFVREPLRRSVEKVYFPIGVMVGLTAYAMSAYSIGGWVERSAVFFFDSLFLYSLVRAWRFLRSDQPDRARRWLLRSIAILLGIATTRPVMGIFFATSALTHLNVDQFFGLAFWAGFSINVVLFECWARWSDREVERSGMSRAA